MGNVMGILKVVTVSSETHELLKKEAERQDISIRDLVEKFCQPLNNRAKVKDVK